MAPRPSALSRNRGLRTAALLLALVLAALTIRSLVAAPRLVPSESMLPTLMPGDLMLVAKWPYGYSRHSLPLGLPLFSGRLFGRLPERGDIVVVRAAGSDHDEVKRVIGLPGDSLTMRAGELRIDGARAYRLRIADLVLPVTPNNRCRGKAERQPDGSRGCRYRRYREMLPDGSAHRLIDIADDDGDAFATLRVPPGQLFLLGDNRDRSLDSRTGGPVPVDRLIGRPLLIFWSTDGSGDWLRPWTWWRAARPERIGLVPE